MEKNKRKKKKEVDVGLADSFMDIFGFKRVKDKKVFDAGETQQFKEAIKKEESK